MVNFVCGKDYNCADENADYEFSRPIPSRQRLMREQGLLGTAMDILRSLLDSAQHDNLVGKGGERKRHHQLSRNGDGGGGVRPADRSNGSVPATNGELAAAPSSGSGSEGRESGDGEGKASSTSSSSSSLPSRQASSRTTQQKKLSRREAKFKAAMARITRNVSRSCFQLLYYSIRKNPEIQRFVAKKLPVFVTHSERESVATRCIVEMLQENRELQETEVSHFASKR